MKKDIRYNLAMLFVLFALLFTTCTTAEAFDQDEDSIRTISLNPLNDFKRCLNNF